MTSNLFTDMKIKQYIVDAFAERTFEGNPAAICVLERWLPDELMQKIASETTCPKRHSLFRQKIPTD